MIKLRVLSSARDLLTVIRVYAPILKATNNTKQACFEFILQVPQRILRNKIVVLLGNVNAKDRTDDRHNADCPVGKSSDGKINDNERLLVNLCKM